MAENDKVKQRSFVVVVKVCQIMNSKNGSVFFFHENWTFT